MKKIFGRREKAKEDLTVEAVVVQKENLMDQLGKQERKFEESRGTMNRSIAAMEKQELLLREDALIERKRQLEQEKRANQESQEKLEEQIKALKMKLEEQRSLHAQLEEGLEAEIRGMVLQVKELRESHDRRVQLFGEPLHTQVLTDKCVRRRKATEGDQEEDSGRESLASISTLVAQEEEKERRKRVMVSEGRTSTRRKDMAGERDRLPKGRPRTTLASGSRQESQDVENMIATVQDLLRPA